jgi:hypothetical protein
MIPPAQMKPNGMFNKQAPNPRPSPPKEPPSVAANKTLPIRPAPPAPQLKHAPVQQQTIVVSRNDGPPPPPGINQLFFKYIQALYTRIQSLCIFSSCLLVH